MKLVRDLVRELSKLIGKGLFTNYVISELTYMVLQIMIQHDAIYLVGSLIMMNDGPSLLSLEFAIE